MAGILLYEGEHFSIDSERVYEQQELYDVSLGKKYMTSLYWALTMVMKSPWLAPRPSGEQAFACLIVVCGAIVFAAFIGNM